MAITPRTILSSPAPATVAAVSLLAFTALGTLAYKVAQENQNHNNVYTSYAHNGEAMCDGVREVLGDDKHSWSEADWVVYTSCFEQKNNSRMAVSVATQGLRFYPHSEVLYNIKGYHQIVLGEHAEAVRTLEQGLGTIRHPTNGVMQNNLAWASLWAPRQLELDRARTLYQKALSHDPDSCETIHTGLWVEYALSQQTRGIEKYDAYKKFLELRQDYEPCLARAERGDWKTVVEVVGATVLFDKIDQNLEPDDKSERLEGAALDGREELLDVSKVLRANYKGVSIDALCGEAMPVASTHHMCVDRVADAVHDLKQRESAGEVEAAKREVRKAVRGKGSLNCPMRAD